MNGRTGRTLALALLFGAIADAVFTWLPPRLDLAALVAMTVAAVATLSWLLDGDLAESAPLLLGGGIAGVAALVWRDSPVLLALNLLAVAGCVLAGSPAGETARLRVGGVTEWLWQVVQSGIATIAGALPAMATEIRWSDLPLSRPMRRAASAAVGIAAALPVVLLFGGLFVSADPLFAQAVERTFTWNVDRFATHAARITLGAWLAAGFLGALVTTPNRVPIRAAPGSMVGPVAVGTALGSIALLFAVFVASQVPYLFGGAEHVARLAGLSYAEYARRGFFELVMVAALTLPLLLVADWALDKESTVAVHRIRTLALVMPALLGVILASALSRMALYTGAYGLTELRLYTAAFMGWLVVVFAWFAATVLRGARERFLPGALVAAGCLIVALDVLNPDALIARVNLDRAIRGGTFDADYAVTLSADAVPAVVGRATRLAADQRCAVAGQLAERWRTAPEGTAVPWTLARMEARRSVRAALPGLLRGCAMTGGG